MAGPTMQIDGSTIFVRDQTPGRTTLQFVPRQRASVGTAYDHSEQTRSAHGDDAEIEGLPGAGAVLLRLPAVLSLRCHLCRCHGSAVACGIRRRCPASDRVRAAGLACP